MIPGYPILCGAFFVCLGIFYTYQQARECDDITYTVLLPVRKRDVVTAKYMDSVTELPPLAKQLNFTAADYAYDEMPSKAEDGTLTIRAMTEAGEQEAILFESKDNGATWAYAGVDTKE